MTNVSHIHMAATLKKLDASDDCCIDQKGIEKLSLVGLDIAGNKKITDLSHMELTLIKLM